MWYFINGFMSLGSYGVVQMSNTTNGTNNTKEIQISKVKCQNKFKIKKPNLDLCSIWILDLHFAFSLSHIPLPNSRF